MAVVDRDGISPSPDELEALVRMDAVGDADRRPTEPEPAWSRPALVLLAVLSASAGAIHFALAPAHLGEWAPAGAAFLVAGWIQLGVAVALVARPSRAVLRLSCLANVVFIGAWLVTRIWGWPVGPEAGIPESASFVDGTTVALEAALVLGGGLLLARPRLGARLSHGAMVILSVVPLALILLTSFAIASPSATSHSHGGVEGADGHAHGHDEAAVDDKGLSLLMNGAGEGGGHVHSTSVVPVDPATQQYLDEQIAAMKPFIEKYPTVKDAEAAGYHRQGPYSPGLGAHYLEGKYFVNPGPTMSEEALKHPMLIYDGITPDAKLAGFMYNILSFDTQTSPEGFIGPNDHWHYHTNVCLTVNPDGTTDAPLGADASATKELCDAYGGRLLANTGYMVHVWPVPGYESPQGMFSNLNPKMTCPNGTYYIVPLDQVGKRTNVCRDVPA